MSIAPSGKPALPSLADFVGAALLRDEPSEAFTLVAPDLLAVAVNGRLRARASAVVAGSGNLRITPASRFGSLTGKDASGGVLAGVDGRGRVLLGDAGKPITLLALTAAESLGIAPHALLAMEDAVSISALPIRLPLPKPAEWHGVLTRGPGRLAFVSLGAPHALRILPASPLFVRAGAVVAWSAGLELTGRVGAAGDARIAFAGDGFVLVQSGV
jgi:uncharacterized protein (AIM24 family)